MEVFKVFIGEKIKAEIINFPKEDKTKIRNFIKHVQDKGLIELEGKNKKSDEVPKDDHKWREKVSYAKKWSLWHYHIGIPNYSDGKYGDKTSEYIIHYRLINNVIKIVDFSSHPPFKLPRQDYLY